MSLRANNMEHALMQHTATITRRNFFSRTAFFFGATAVANEFCRAQAAQPAVEPAAQRANELDASRAIGLGFSLYGMKTLSVEDALTALSEMGYDCTELPVMKEWPADSATFTREKAARWRDMLAARRLRLSALMENLPALGNETAQQANLDRLKRAGQIARELAPNDTSRPVIETIMGGKAGDFEAVKGKLVERLGEWAKVLAEAQVKLAVKAHISNATQQPAQVAWLLDQVASPWLVAAYDYSHFERQSLDMAQSVEQLVPRAGFIHVKDSVQVNDKWNFVLPGEGKTDYVRLLKLIRDAGYRGDVVVEVSSQVSNAPGYQPLAAARSCYNHLSRAFKEAGVIRG
jgi:sugar phosphate isomerase/epimerase